MAQQWEKQKDGTFKAVKKKKWKKNKDGTFSAAEDDIAPVKTTTNEARNDIAPVDTTREASWKDIFVNSFSRGYQNSVYGTEMYKKMIGQENEADVAKKILEKDKYQFETDNKIKGAISGAMEMLGQQWYNITDKDTIAAIGLGGLAGAAVATVGGQAGPQVAAPEEVITVPTATLLGARAGLTAASAKNAFEMEAGLAYNEMLELGISEETAQKIAFGVGGVNAAIEVAQVDELIDAFKIANKTGATDTLLKKITKELVARGVDVAKETAQEVTQEGVTIAGAQLGSKIDTDEWAYDSEEVGGRLGETAMSSALTFGVMNVPATVSNVTSEIVTNKNKNTLTKNEAMVAEAEVENRIAEAEKDGKKLTAKEKANIRSEVMSDLERGQISTDTIEEVLGGEDYKRYKAESERQESLKTELDELRNMKSGDMTDIQRERMEELKLQSPSNPEMLNTMKFGIDENIRKEITADGKRLGKNRGSYLAESYNEVERSGQAFTVDLKQYDAKHAELLKGIMDKKQVNNTRKAHDFWEYATGVGAKLGLKVTSATTDEILEIETNRRGEKWLEAHSDELIAEYGEEWLNEHREELIQEHGKAWVKEHLEGKTPNGIIMDDGTLALNVNSPRVREVTFGHEIGHFIQKAGNYENLSKLIIEYAEKIEGKEAFAKRKADVESLYADGVGDANIELTNDLIGEYIYGDKNADFIKHLSVENKNLFQQLWDEVKYLYKTATAGSQEAKDLLRIKKEFEKAYRESANVKTEAKGESQLSLSEAKIPTKEDIDKKNPMRVVDISTPQTEGTFAERRKQIRENAKDVIKKPYLNSDTNSLIFLTDKSYTHLFSNGGEWQLNAAEHLPELIESAVLTHAEENTHGSDYANGIYTFFAAGKTKDGIRPVKLKVKEYVYSGQDLPKNIKEYFENSPQGYAASYDTVVLEVEEIEENPAGSVKDVAQKEPFLDPDGFLTYKVADLLDLVKGDSEKYLPKKSEGVNYSLSTDSDGNKLTKEQGDYFKDSKMRDENGSLKVMYHGSQDAGFHEFNSRFSDSDIRYSLSYANEPIAKGAMSETAAEDDILPTFEEALPKGKSNLGEGIPEGTVPKASGPEKTPIQTTKEKIDAKLQNSQTELDNISKLREESMNSYNERIDALQSKYDAKKNKDTKVANQFLRQIENLKRLRDDVDADYEKRIRSIQTKIGRLTEESQKDYSKADRLEVKYRRIEENLEQDKAALQAEFDERRTELQAEISDKNSFVRKKALELYRELQGLQKGVRASKDLGYLLDQRATTNSSWDSLRTSLLNAANSPDKMVNQNSVMESAVRGILNENYESCVYEADNLDNEYNERVSALEQEAENERKQARESGSRIKRSELHKNFITKLANALSKAGFDLNTVLKNAKNLSTIRTVDNTPQRVMTKAFGYKAGNIISDLTINQTAQNEADGIKWLNSFTDRKHGILAQISKQYGIKPGSKESAAAQMYGEGFFVDKNGDYIAYGDAELAKDFPNERARNNIKALAKDERIRQIYDETLDAINESRERNAYPPIPRLDNYYLHFQAMTDYFSRLGIPFNPNDMMAMDLPTDKNGMTADLKPGQPFFASSMHRQGNRTTYDLIGGLERYLSSAKNQIYHIDDIQNFRALRNYIADIYGQASGFEGLDELNASEMKDRIEQINMSHLSTMARFLNEEANIIAGKKAMLDRGLEALLGRRAIAFVNSVNKQVGSNLVGGNLSSPFTNLISVVQGAAKSNKTAFAKAFVQMASNKTSSIFGRKLDNFTEESPVVIRRKGAERFNRTFWEESQDLGYALMGEVDNIATELIARTKFNEFRAKGMSEQKAHFETDKWVSKLMGDRSLGQMPQIYNSKLLDIVGITKFQLEVRNQLDSQFYDTIQEAKASNEYIENGLKRNAKTAAKVTSTLVQLAVMQHLFGTAFESVAGYNPAFDIIDVIIKTFGWDDDEDSEDEPLDNLTQGFQALLEDLPYISTITGGGRIPIGDALPITRVITMEDEYGNKKEGWEGIKESGKAIAEALPYYVLPTGYGQLKKSAKGLSMFDPSHPVSGSYTDSGDLRFPVEDNLKNLVQAGVFGQWANENAREYFDNDIAPLKKKQIQEFIDVDIPIREYWDYREGLAEQETLEDKFDYVNNLDLPLDKKNILINNIVDREESVDLSNYDDFSGYEEFDFATKNPERYEFFQANGISYSDYASADEEGKRAYSSAYTWAKENPGMLTLSKTVTSDVMEYRGYIDDLYDIRADKDSNGKTINGSAKRKKVEYINGLELDYGQRIILFKSLYESDDTYNAELVEYLNNRSDISYEDTVTILRELGFRVDSQGNVYW